MHKIKILYSYVFLVTFAFLVIGAINSNSDDNSNTNEGRIKFSHALHKDLVSCQDCHSAVVKSVSLKDQLFPNHDNCSACHEVDNDEQCSTCHYGDNFEALVKSKTDLIFNHKIHLSDDVNCESCHLGLTEVDYSWQSAAANPPMEKCYSCHNDKTVASNACESCHISTVDLTPQDHKVVSFMRNHKFSAEQFDANCIMCHDNQSCNDCHIATTGITEVNLKTDFYQPYYPSNYIDGAKIQAINRVHEINYRFSHGIDSKGKTAECQTCHQIETFCSECHQADNQDFAFSGIVPASHLKSTFKTIGFGSGGGDHASLAKRDIENCMSCHDINGGDPTCITCHFDADGIKNTNPKTHPAGFMRGEKGDWHTDISSVCYNCHTSATPASQPTAGFCSYCHQ